MGAARSLAWASFAVLAGFSSHVIAAGSPVTYVQDNFIGAPVNPAQLLYSPAYDAVVMRTPGGVWVMDTATGAVSSATPNSQFSDMSLSPDGRYVYLADYAFSGGRIGRIDLESGAYASKPVAGIPYRIEATDGDKFVITSQDQWISFWRGSWGTGANISILNSNPGGYYASVYYGDIEFDRNARRIIHGNNGSSSREISAFALVNDNFVVQEDSGTYGSADAYGGSTVLATDASRFYYGRLQVLASDVRQNQLVFPATIVAATGGEAFTSGGDYYDAATAQLVGNLGYPVTVYGLGHSSNDFWAFDPSTGNLRHFVPAGGPPPAPGARPDYAGVAQGYAADIDVTANDTGFAGSVTVTIVTPPQHGTATVIGSPGDTRGIRVRYLADPGYVGPDSFEYTIDDGSNAGTASVGISVAAAKAVNDSYVMLRNSYQSLYVARNDVGFGPQVTLSIVGQPAQGGSAYVSSSQASIDSVYVTYQPAYNRPAPYTDTFSYQISDGTRTDTAFVSVKVVDYAAIDDEIVTGEGQPATIDLTANDLGFGFGRYVALFTNPQHGTVTLAGGSATYQPAPGFLGQDTFEYLIEDGTRVDIATVRVSVILDADQDKVSDTVDNCLGLANANQRDTDGDGFGNACDADLNNDGRVNFTDLSIFRSRFATSDPHADFDGNGVVSYSDLVRLRTVFGGAPGPSAVAP